MLEIYPAIDLKDGKAVRLLRGEMASAKIYGEALEFAKAFEDMGARWLHIVDLDGAFAGKPQNLRVIEKILNATHLSIQLGGGIRDEKSIQFYTQLGIKRVIMGSMAMKNWAFVQEKARIYPIAVGIDARDGKVATQGWVEKSELDSKELARKFANSAIKAIICTDIARDGALSGINIDFTQEIAKNSGIYTIASGGFAEFSQLYELDTNPHISGVIIGRAFYEGQINLKNALKTFSGAKAAN